MVRQYRHGHAICGAFFHYFQMSRQKKDPKSEVHIQFGNKTYQGWVTVAKKGRSSPAYRLWFEETLSLELKHTFLMSYMRSLETGLSPLKTSDIETSIPFWEFLDIEFDADNRKFHFVAYYRQEPSFPNLFARLIGSPAIARVADEVADKKKDKIYKQDWKERKELEYEIGATNVIYHLIDTNNKLIYIGEAADLVKRLYQKYPTIPKWNYFRYNVLPENLSSFRVTLERMMIRDFAALLENKRDIEAIKLSDYKLANDKIDK